MATCSCGTDNPDGAPRCATCGKALVTGVKPLAVVTTGAEVVMRNPPMPGPGLAPQKVHVPAPRAWREVLSADPTEHALVAAIRANPSDDAARMVYADWLEQRDLERARFVRHEGYLPRGAPTQLGDLAWRTITSRAPIELCGRVGCPGRWDRLAAKPDDERMRTCGTCKYGVLYCANSGDASAAGTALATPIAIDATADVDDLVSWYRLGLVHSRG